MIHENYFKLPLKHDEYASFMVWTEDNERAIDIIRDDKKLQKDIIKTLNGEKDDFSIGILTYENGEIFENGKILLRIRSWGNLTGIGGHNLPAKEAAAIQDSFAEWIIEKLTNPQMDKSPEFKQYRRTKTAEIRPYVVGEELGTNVSISMADLRNGSPKEGDMIARNPKNHEDQWLIAKDYFKDNFEELERKQMSCYNCGGQLIWNNDFTYEDYGREGDGIVAVLSCEDSDCDVDLVEVYMDNEKNEE